MSVLIIEEGVKFIDKFAYACNPEVEEVILPKTVTQIRKAAFWNCPKLRRVCAESVLSVSESAFEDCSALSEVTFGALLNKIEGHAFEGCKDVTFIAPVNSYAEQYAKNNYIFCKHPKGDTEGRKLTVKEVTEIAKAAEQIKPMLNLNKIIIGGSGTGKSRFYVKPNLMQLNTSFVITDPSGELLRDCGKMLERNGYKIRVFNIEDMTHSNNYNPFYYLRDSFEEGAARYKPEYVIKMINTFMLNTKGEGQSGDPFWDNSTEIFLSAIVFLLLETADSEEQLNWGTVLDMVHKAEVDDSKPDKKSELDLIFEAHAAEDKNAMSIQSYTEFSQAAGKTKQSILINSTARLKNFKTQAVRDLTCTDNIHLETLGDEKTALFIIIPSSDTTFSYLAAMMYQQLFDTLYSQAMHKYKGKLKVPVQFICDEFANTGKIPDFDKILATCRKFQISVDVILQNLSQLKRLYEKSWEELPGNCDTMLYLGGKDQSTNEFIMKELGKETIDTLSKNKSKGKQGSTSYNDGIMGRELMQLNELSTMENSNCIIMIRGLNPFITPKFDIKNHPNYKLLYEGNSETQGNFFSLEENVHTETECTLINMEEYYDDNAVIEAEVDQMDVEFRVGDKVITTVEDLRRELGIDKKAQDMFVVA